MRRDIRWCPIGKRSAPRAVTGRRVLVACAAVALLAAPASAAETPANPRLSWPAGHLGRAAEEPPFICVHGAFGASFSGAQGEPGYGGSIVFRPPAAANFLDLLYAWNTGIVLQYDRLGLAPEGYVRSCDLIFRRYFASRERSSGSVQAFAGGGLGVSSVTARSGELAGLPNDWSWVLEGGQEWRAGRGRLVFVKAQVRLLNVYRHDVSRWALLAGAGLPFPW